MAYYSFIGEFTVSFEADRSERSEEWYCLFLKKVDTIIRSLRLLERAASGTREEQMERREAPYPYSKKGSEGLVHWFTLSGRCTCPKMLNKEFRISDPIQIALILLDLQLNIEILQVTHVMD